MSIKVWRLINGDEIIGEVFNQFDQFVEVKNPAQIVLQKTEQGVGVGLAPTMPYVEGIFKLMRAGIALEGDPNKQMANEYNRVFGSGIQVVPASALSGLATAT
jgi:hypothetical protein